MWAYVRHRVRAGVVQDGENLSFMQGGSDLILLSIYSISGCHYAYLK